MQLVANHSALLLDRCQTVELVDAAGATATLDHGCLWITMDGDQRDIVLNAGQSWTVERNGRTLLHAGAPSTLRISDPAAVPAPQPAMPRLRAALADWLERDLRRSNVPYY